VTRRNAASPTVPEGDTIHRAAARLRAVLEREPLVAISVPRWSGALPQPGETIDAVRAIGKHLVVDFSGGLSLRVHLRMTGRWRVYARGEISERASYAARVLIEVPAHAVACFDAPDVALTRRDRVAVGHLGPDLCEPDVDLDAVMTRIGSYAGPTTTIGEALLDQRIACGIGNVYKSEALFAERVDPTVAVADLATDRRRAVFARAHRQLRENLARGGPRRTVPQGLAVYGRAGRPCRVCGTPVVRIVQGAEQPRSTYFCPECQHRR
jgi:endonuclease VIII